MKKTLGHMMVIMMMPLHMLKSMENDNHKVNLKLVDDHNKIYSIARWKVIQDSSQIDTLNIPEITEQQVSFFDKELDKINLEVVERNDDVLKLEIKKKIMLHHLSVYKAAFDYFLVSMIADNIASNRVKAEETHKFIPQSVIKLPTQDLHIPPIEKLGKNTFQGRILVPDENLCVTTKIPLSTMSCMALSVSHDICEVHVYDTKENSKLDHIGIVNYSAKNINGLGVTTDLKYLVATFDDNLVSKAELYSKEDFDLYKEITSNIKLADIYLLFHLYKVKKEKLYEEFQSNECDYVRDHIAKTEKGKKLIRKHFLS